MNEWGNIGKDIAENKNKFNAKLKIESFCHFSSLNFRKKYPERLFEANILNCNDDYQCLHFSCHFLHRCELLLPPVEGIIMGELAERNPLFFAFLKTDDIFRGTIVDRNTVITAANCVYRQEKRQWASASEIFVLQRDFLAPNDWSATRYFCDDYKAQEDHDPCFMRDTVL